MIPVSVNVFGMQEREILDGLEERRWKGVRVGVESDDLAVAYEIVGQYARRPLHPLVLVGDDDCILDSVVARARNAAGAAISYGIRDPAVEVTNEPNNAGRKGNRYAANPRLFGQTVRAVYEALPPTVRVISGGIMSTSKESLAYLRAAMPEIPDGCTIGIHTYRSGRPDDPLPGFSSRAEEFAELRSITGSRPVWCTEVGWHTARPPKKWYECRGKRALTDDEVASNLRREIVVCEENGIERLVVFQLNDGPNADYESHFGIRYLDGRWKPSSLVTQVEV